MQIQFGKHVLSLDGKDVGKVKHLILEPSNGRVKTLVLEKGLFLPEDIEVPSEAVQENGSEGLSVRYTAEEVKALPHFDESRYLPVTLEQPRWFLGFPYNGALWPIGYPIKPFGAGTPLAVPVVDGEITLAPPPDVKEHLQKQDEENAIISAGDTVLSHDGEKVGEVHSVTFDADTGKPTNLEIRQGWLFHKDRTLPADLIDSIDDGVVYLNLDKAALQEQWGEEHTAPPS